MASVLGIAELASIAQILLEHLVQPVVLSRVETRLGLVGLAENPFNGYQKPCRRRTRS